MVLSKSDAQDQVRRMLRWRQAEFDRLEKIHSYVRGEQRFKWLPAGVPNEVRQLADMSKVNVLPLVADAVTQSMYVDGYRVPLSHEDAPQWDLFQANRMDARQTGVHRACSVYGASYVTVLPGEPVPVIRGASPRRMTTVYGDDDDWPMWALEKRRSAEGHLYRLFDDEAAYWVSVDDGGEPTYITHDEHDLGVVPVIRFLDVDDLDDEVVGEIEPLIPLQDQINVTTFSLLVAQHYGAHKQRYILGWMAKSEEERLKSQAAKVWEFEDPDIEVGEFTQTSLDGYISSREATLRHLATISQTAAHELLGQLVNLPLALDTVVPVPGGRTTIGELRVGDEVFDPDGSPVEVVGLSPIYTDRKCYKLTFDDGTTVVADADHLWKTTHFVSPHAAPYRHGRETSVINTQQIAATLKTCMGTNNHFIPVARGHDGPEREYPVDPYVLGVWLGDGDENGAITQHVDDAYEMAAILENCGERVKVAQYWDGGNRYKITFPHDFTRCPYGHERPRGTHDEPTMCKPCYLARYQTKSRGTPMPERVNDSFQRRLRDLGVRWDKHIPERYFHGSYKQRLALLQGIMDTDGSVKGGQGSVALTLHNERLMRDVHRLAQSLGQKVAVKRSRWKNALGEGDCWRMAWSAQDHVFRLTRKRERQRAEFGGGDGKSNNPLRRYIVACEEVESIPVRCIKVASDAHMFCVTDAFIATHNSAEALAAAEASNRRKIREREKVRGEAWEQVLGLGGQLIGVEPDPKAQVRWQDTEARSLAATVDALGKMAQMLGVPVQALWERIPGASQQDVETWKSLASEGDAFARLEGLLDRQAAETV